MPSASFDQARMSSPSASPPLATERRSNLKRWRGEGTVRIILRAVGGRKALRTPCRAISANASSGSNLGDYPTVDTSSGLDYILIHENALRSGCPVSNRRRLQGVS